MCCLNNILVSKFKKKEPTYFLLIFSKTTIKIGQKNWIVLHTFLLYSWKIMDNTSINIQTDMNGHTMTFALTCHVSGALTVWRVKQTRAQRRMGKCTWHLGMLKHSSTYYIMLFIQEYCEESFILLFIQMNKLISTSFRKFCKGKVLNSYFLISAKRIFLHILGAFICKWIIFLHLLYKKYLLQIILIRLKSA